jgi:pyruvate formate lyase activating enzyme
MQRRVSELLYDEERCSTSVRCVEACPQDALAVRDSGGVELDRELCDGCGDCVEVCPSGALELAGRSVSAGQLFKELIRDSDFFRRSGGGVTIGGGEPTDQPVFVAELLKLSRRRFLHTAMETCGRAEWDELRPLLEKLDLVYIDIKHMDDAVHRELTGASNVMILENIRRSAELCSVVLRVPVVPGYNDSEENIRATACFAASLGRGFEHLELLPYHRLGVDVYRRLGRDYELDQVEPPDEQRLAALKKIAENEGITVRVGG